MGLSRNAMYLLSAGAVAAVSATVIGLRTWRAEAPPPAPVTASNAPAAIASAVPAAAPAARAAPAGQAAPIPSFDVVRVEPTGEAVVAGRAAPQAQVTLLDNGKPAATVQADAGGQFALTPSFAAGPHELSLDAPAQGGLSRQSVTVVVPKSGAGGLVVALAEPGQPTRVLSDAPPAGTKPAPGTAAGSSGRVFIHSVEVGQDGGFFASGTAAAGASLRLYLNDSPIASVKADGAGAWALKVDRGLSAGSYKVRADALAADGTTVVARAETTFDFAGFAPHGAAVTAAAGGAPSSPSKAEIADLSTVRVSEGDSLWAISRRIFGQGMRYTLIYEANSNQIRDRDLIYPGQVFVVPKK